MTMDMSRYLGLFVTEASEHLEALGRDLVQLEREGKSASSVDSMFRHAHSVKGMASSMGFEPIAILSHRVEDLVGAVREDQGRLSRELVDLLLTATDTLLAQVRAVAENKPPEDAAALLSQARRALLRTHRAGPRRHPRRARRGAQGRRRGLDDGGSRAEGRSHRDGCSREWKHARAGRRGGGCSRCPHRPPCFRARPRSGVRRPGGSPSGSRRGRRAARRVRGGSGERRRAGRARRRERGASRGRAGRPAALPRAVAHRPPARCPGCARSSSTSA